MRKRVYILLLLISGIPVVSMQAQSSQQIQENTQTCPEGEQFFANYQFQKALQSYQQCYRFDSLNTTILKKIAVCYYRLGHYANAEEKYRELLSIQPMDISTLNNLAKIHLKQEEFHKALELYKKLINLDYTNSYYHKKIADISWKHGDISNALNHYEVTLMYNPEDIEAIDKLVQIYRGLKVYQQADTLLNLGLSIDSDNPRLIKQKALMAYHLGNYDEVISTLRSYLKRASDTTVFHMKMLGASYYHEKNYIMAITTLNIALSGSQNPELIHYYLGLSYKSYGDKNRSIFHLRKAIDSGISSNISEYYKNLAAIYEDNGNYKKAIDSYKAAWEGSKEKVLLYYLAVNCDKYYEDKSVALKYYRQYVAEYDTANRELLKYSRQRISRLEEEIHFQE